MECLVVLLGLSHARTGWCGTVADVLTNPCSHYSWFRFSRNVAGLVLLVRRCEQTPAQAKIPSLTNRDVQTWSPLLCPGCYHSLMVPPVCEEHCVRFSDTEDKTREEISWETWAVSTSPSQPPLLWGSTGSRPMRSSAVAFPWGRNSLALFILAHTEGISLRAIPIYHCMEQKEKNKNDRNEWCKPYVSNMILDRTVSTSLSVPTVIRLYKSALIFPRLPGLE